VSLSVRVIQGDCRSDLKELGPFDMLLADPPYGETSLDWDEHCDGWIKAAAGMLKATGSMWVFGSMRFFQQFGREFAEAGFTLAQDVVWEKHNGSGFHADRFKRVHEHACQFYLASAPWKSVYNTVQTTPDAVARRVKRNRIPPHTAYIDPSNCSYESFDGGPRIMRSVIYMRSMHGHAIHPTEKPPDLLEILIRTSCPPGGVVGDMFAGSGSCGEAALRTGRCYVGIELASDMVNKARDRIASTLPLVIPDANLAAAKTTNSMSVEKARSLF